MILDIFTLDFLWNPLKSSKSDWSRLIVNSTISCRPCWSFLAMLGDSPEPGDARLPSVEDLEEFAKQKLSKRALGAFWIWTFFSIFQ